MTMKTHAAARLALYRRTAHPAARADSLRLLGAPRRRHLLDTRRMQRERRAQEQRAYAEAQAQIREIAMRRMNPSEMGRPQ